MRTADHTPVPDLPEGVQAPWPPRAADRDGWPPGEWDREPDFDGWVDRRTGLACATVRNWRLGHWCGYVAVTPGHRLFGLDYMDVSGLEGLQEVSYSCLADDAGLYWFGTHFGDAATFMPGYDQGRGPGRSYRSLAAAKEAIAALAWALHQVGTASQDAR